MSFCINPNCPKPENEDTLLFCQSCGSELLLDGRYRVLRQLGSGGFGNTYEVRDCTPPHLSGSNSEFKVLKVLSNNHPKYIELFQREAQVLSRFNHPGIPKVEADAYFTFNVYKNPEPLHCLVMEKIEGLDLKEYITRRGTGISQKRAIQWLLQLVPILRVIHQHNLFHRDIKPSNIMLRADGQLVLIDFGTAREITDTYLSKKSAGQATGLFSAGYSPPEQLHGQAIPQSDFFAMGRTFVFLLTGKHPSELYDSYIDELRWRQVAPEIAPSFADFLDRLMSRLPIQRPQSAEIILQELDILYRSLYTTDNTSSRLSSLSSEVPIAQPSQHNPSSGSGFAALQPTEIADRRSQLPHPPPLPLPPPPPSATPSLTTTVEMSLIPAGSPGRVEPSLNQAFIDRCRQELAELIGPMATIICQRVLSKGSQLSVAEFVKALAQKIPDAEQAEEFQKRLLDGAY